MKNSLSTTLRNLIENNLLFIYVSKECMWNSLNSSDFFFKGTRKGKKTKAAEKSSGQTKLEMSLQSD